MKTHRQIFYTGRVQGVGFRYTVKQIAAGYEVVGWVRNLPDGRVEMQVGGETDELEIFLQALADSHLAGYLKATTCVDLPAPEIPWTGFEIRH